MNRLTLRLRWTVVALTASVVAGAGGCATSSPKPPTAHVSGQLLPGSTIAVADAFGTKVFSSPRSIAARKAATATYAAAPE